MDTTLKVENGSTITVKNQRPSGVSDFLHSRPTIEEGDTVIIYVNFGSTYAIRVRRGMTLTMRYGALRHEYLIGKRYGSRISATAGYVYVLRPNPELWTRALPHRTQILYTPDCALIAMLLDARPGSVIAESGTGSGSLTHALARTIAPTGRLYSFDIDNSRVLAIIEELKHHGLDHVTTVRQRNVCTDGFDTDLVDRLDGVFLDLPNPWDAIVGAKRALRQSTSGGRLVAFSPCIEQVQRTCDALRLAGFVQIETVELVPKTYKVVEIIEERFTSTATAEPLASTTETQDEDDDAAPVVAVTKQGRRQRNNASKNRTNRFGVMPYPVQQPTHTGYLTSATLLPSLTALA